MAALTIAAITVRFEPAEAGKLDIMMEPRSAIHHIQFATSTLPPMAFTQFCLRYNGECRQQRTIFRGGPVKMTRQRAANLRAINDTVNDNIAPHPNLRGLAGEEWLINPDRGDCNDYAVSKRHMLLERGWPARALLLSEVKMASGEHHLVLVVRSDRGDLVLDNMTRVVRAWNKVPYKWVRMQSASDPNIWSKVAPAGGGGYQHLS
jgi:predicted transglutaminase-like cysteine proteinase